MVTKVRDVSDKVDSPPNIIDLDVSQHDPLDADFPVNVQLLTRNLILFTVLKTIGSFDSGAFSAALGAENGIAEEWGLSTVHQGTLSSSVFLGNILGCPLSGNLFSRYSAKVVLVWSLILHTLFTFFFATLTEYRIALLCRFLIGITLSFVIVYTPVWVDTFAPRDRQSMWMASHNAGVPLGIMLGYCIGAFLPSYTNVNWEWAFYIKCIITIPAVAYLIRVDSRSIDRRITVNCTNRSDTVTSQAIMSTLPHRRAAERIFNILHSNISHMWRTCLPLFRSTEYMCSMLAMCSLYFVVTGLQNFVTQYLRDEPFKASMKTIMVGFGGAVVTAPVLGVITGGILLDRIGGYQCNLRRVTTFTCVWGVAAAFFSVMCIFVTSTRVFLLVISIVLFCGGAIIPPGSGTVVASVPEQLRPVGAAFSQMMYNLLGNFSGPMVCGVVADFTGDLKYGIYTVLSFSVVGLIPMVVLLRKAYSMPELLEATTSTTTTSVLTCARLRRQQEQEEQEKQKPQKPQLLELDAESVLIEMNGMGSMKSESPRTVLEEDDMALFDMSSSSCNHKNNYNNNNSNNNNYSTHHHTVQNTAVSSGGGGGSTLNTNTLGSISTTGTLRSHVHMGSRKSPLSPPYPPTTTLTTNTNTNTTTNNNMTTNMNTNMNTTRPVIPMLSRKPPTTTTTTTTTTTRSVNDTTHTMSTAQRPAPYVVVVENTTMTPHTSVETFTTLPSQPLPITSTAALRYSGSEVSTMADQHTGGYRSNITDNRSHTNRNSHANHMSCSNSLASSVNCSYSSLCCSEAEADEANYRLELEADAAQMMSFPNQHNFGLDMLRSWLNSSLRRNSSSRHSSERRDMDNSLMAPPAQEEEGEEEKKEREEKEEEEEELQLEKEEEGEEQKEEEEKGRE